MFLAVAYCYCNLIYRILIR